MGIIRYVCFLGVAVLSMLGWIHFHCLAGASRMVKAKRDFAQAARKGKPITFVAFLSLCRCSPHARFASTAFYEIVQHTYTMLILILR